MKVGCLTAGDLMDLEKFFDRVNHSKLIEILSRIIKDGRVVSLIHKYLNAGVQVGGSFQASKLGVCKPKAWQWANTRKSYWYTANSFILTTTITTDKLRQAGYVFLSDHYQKVRIKT